MPCAWVLPIASAVGCPYGLAPTDNTQTSAEIASSQALVLDDAEPWWFTLRTSTSPTSGPTTEVDVRALAGQIAGEDVVERAVRELQDQPQRVLLGRADPGAVQVHDGNAAAACQIHNLALDRSLPLRAAGVHVVRVGLR